MRDVALVARFEVLRAIRTWRALALLVVYAIAAGGATWMFTRAIGELENALAVQLGVGTTQVPGTMLAELVESEYWLRALTVLTGDPALAREWVDVPPLAVFGLWFGFLVVPFFAASAAAECVAIDVQSRAIRWEAQRTGRLELILGRFVGQLALTTIATSLAMVVVWAVGMLGMVGNEPVPLAAWLASFLPRVWAFGVPFAALGAGVSQLTTSPAWARVLALAGTAGSWVAYGVGVSYGLGRSAYAVVADVYLPLLPQAWLRGLWEPGPGWWVSAVACGSLGAAALVVGFVRFSQRDL
jgi:hypothetical protein